MSKKNNKKIIARKHAHDLELEKKAQEKLQKQREKAERQKQRQQQAAAAAAGAAVANPVGPVKKVKVKALRLKRGMKVRGIKITNNDTKSQVLDILKAEQAAKMMDIEQPDAAAMAAAVADKKLKKKKKKLKLAKDAKSSKSSKKAALATAAGGTAAPMEG